MNDKEFEEVKAVLINWLQQKLLRKNLIDKELFSLIHQDDSKIDFEIANLEKVVSKKLAFMDRIMNFKQHKSDKIKLYNLKIKKSLIINLRNQEIDNLLQEKELLAYNEYNYISRIDYFSNIATKDNINLTEEEIELLKSIFSNFDYFDVYKNRIGIKG